MGEKKKKGSISYAKWGYIFIAPFFIIFAVFQLIPLASTIYYSFFEYYRSGLKIIGPSFVGLKNYITLFKYGSPKKPALVEAMALSFADNVDGRGAVPD